MTLSIRFLALAAALSAWSLAGRARAAEPEQTATAQQPSSPNLISRMEPWFQPTAAVQLQLVSSNEVFGNVSGGVRRGAIFEGLLQPSLQIDLEKLWGWKGASFKASAFEAYGPSLTGRYTHDVSTVSNIDTYDSVRLDEAWLQQLLYDGHLSIRVGFLAADTEFLISETGALFLNSSFGIPASLSADIAAPTFPLAAPGVRVAWDSKDRWLVRAAIFSGDVGAAGGNNQHGARLAFSGDAGALLLAEAVGKLSLTRSGRTLPGSLKLGGFYGTGRYDDLTGGAGKGNGLGGGYVIFDQALYREPAPAPDGKQATDGKQSAEPDQGLNFFCRSSFSAPERSAFVSWYADGGLSYKGLLQGRADDTLGLAVAYLHGNDDLVDDNGARVPRHHETAVELTYQAALGKHLTVQPDCQVIFNPGVADKLPTAVVLGVRCTVTF